MLLHLIDVNEENLVQNYNQVRKELKEYSKELIKKKEIIVLNKTDLIDKKNLAQKAKHFKDKTKKDIFYLSTLNKESISSIKAKLLRYVS
tara:strand:+ start:2929 stop:3198 length:270 start_codon:yes stop_codon:yes gene_type:complete